MTKPLCLTPSLSDVIAFKQAASRGETQTLNFYIRNFGANIINNIDDGESTALYAAASHNYFACLCLLLEAGADTEAVCLKDNGRTPLMATAQSGYDTCLSQLLKHGADIYATDSQGQTALDLAITHKHFNSMLTLENLMETQQRSIENELQVIKDGIPESIQTKKARLKLTPRR